MASLRKRPVSAQSAVTSKSLPFTSMVHVVSRNSKTSGSATADTSKHQRRPVDSGVSMTGRDVCFMGNWGSVELGSTLQYPLQYFHHFQSWYSMV